MCKTTIALLRGQAKAKSILLMLNCNLESDVYFYDEMRVNQILINLMTNAIKFSLRSSHVLVMVKAATVTEDMAQISISVQDTGIGIN
jgi:signal transduction histidine kinase